MPTYDPLNNAFVNKMTFYFQRSDGKKFKFDGLSYATITKKEEEEEIKIKEEDIMSVMECE